MDPCGELFLLHGKAWEKAQTGFFENMSVKAALMGYEWQEKQIM